MSYKGAMGGWTCYDVYSIESEYGYMDVLVWQGWTLISSICDYDYDEGMGGGSGGTGGYGNTSPSHGGGGGSGTYTNNNNTTGGVYGNGGLDGTGIHTVPIVPKKTAKEIKIAFTAFLADPNNPHPTELAWFNSHGSEASIIIAYLTINQTYFVEVESPFQFAQWSINYLISNPAVSFDKFKNWFFNPLEGKEDPNSSVLITANFPSQNLPTMDDFIDAFPSHLDASTDDSQKVFTLIGGAVLTKYNQGARNTCALRISRGLNNSGVTIPNIPGITVKGADNKNYFLVAKNLLTWMKSTFGTPTGSNYITGAQGGDNGKNFPALLQGKQGIYIMIPNDTSASGFDASGHADALYSNQTCDGACYFNATGGVKEIYIWELP